MNKGCIYIMTNPMLHGENGEHVVKIGYADDVEKRRVQLSRTAVPADFRIYATYEVNERLTDQTLHNMIDKLNPDLRIKESMENGKKKVREFYYMEPEDAYNILDAIATISGTNRKLKKWVKTKQQKAEDEEIRASFKFSMIDLKPGMKISLLGHKDVECVIVDDKRVEYKGEIYSLSSLAVKLLKEYDNKDWSAAQGPAYFCYKGKTLRDIRNSMV